MKNRIVITEYNLSNNTVDEISEYVYNYTGNLQLDKSKRIRIRIYLEEILINWLNHFGEGVEVQLVTGKKLGINQLAVRLKGEKHNPINTVDDQYNEYWANVSKQLNLSPSYDYSNGINQITFKVTKDVNSIGQLFFTLLLAAILGFLSQMLPESVRLGVSENILTPIYDSFVGILSTVAGPMIFLSVAWGIYGIGDTETLSKIGRRMLSRFLINTFVATLFSILVCIPLYKLTFANTEIKGDEFSNVFKLLLNIFPKNIVSPFLDGNAMQIILMAIIVGCILVIMGNRTKDVAILIEQISLVINYLMEFVSKLVPGFIFIVVSDMIWKNALVSISTAWKPIVIVLAVAIIALFFNLAILCISNKISFGLIIKKIFPSFIIGITTASSSAAFGTMANSCDKELGINIDKKIRFYQDNQVNLFALYNVSSRINDAISKKVWLNSGAYLYIEHTEAMTVIDVNTGNASKKSKEETFLTVNLEAAKEVVHQLRLRNLSGIIIVDFINMKSKNDCESLLEYINEIIKDDNRKAKCHGMTKLGLVEITREKKDNPLFIQLKDIRND